MLALGWDVPSLQDWVGSMHISDGVTERIYDVTNWTITERKVSPAKTGQ